VLALGLLVAASLFSYRADDPSWWVERPGTPQNWIGPVGANISRGLFELLGFAAVVFPAALVLLAWALLTRGKTGRSAGDGSEPTGARTAGLTILVLSFAMLLGSLTPAPIEFRGDLLVPGGLTGSLLSGAASRQLGLFGAVLIALGGIALGLVLSTRFTVAAATAAAGRPLRRLGQALTVRWARLKEAHSRERARRAVLKKHAKEQKRRQKEQRIDAPLPAVERARRASAEDTPARSRPAIPVPGAREAAPEPPPELIPVSARRTAPPSKAPAAEKMSAATQPLLPMPAPPPRTSPFKLPPIDLLEPAPAESPVDEKELIDRARLIADKLREFSVEGQVVQIHPGPVVTVYEFKPEPGVKYSRILGLTDDLCLALKAESIRVDRIPGKSTVGIEVPNRAKETIFLRDVIAGTAYSASRSRLTLGLGKTLDGEPFVTDLERMPHLLIAGSTGSGKSVGLNCMITSILYKSTPDEVRFIFIDPKMLELGIYDDIPHLLIPVVTDMKKAAVALKWAVREMETRYKTLATTGVRNIEQFNALLARDPGRTKRNEKTGVEEVLTPLPYIVVVIDELADLMMVASIEVEESITRLAQMARAVGIHLVLATQRPSVDVITGIIKANFPARIGFRVSQKVDSRTILDTGGAEALLGHGDMLFLPPGSSRLLRVHGALITEAEAHRVVHFLKEQGRPAYNTSVLKETEEERESSDFEKDEMYDQAVRLVVATGQASISHLQRRLRLGYARAARIVDMMEDEGIIGPGDGAKPRDVLVGSEFLERLDQIVAEP